MTLDAIEKDITLRDGTPVRLRSTKKEDAAKLADFFGGLPEEDRLYLRDDVTREGFVDEYIARFDYDRMIPVLAESEGAIVAEASLYRTRHGWTSHIGVIRVAVARSFQRRGLGNKLIRLLMDIAVGLGLDKIVAEVVADQVSAKRAFEKLGFEHEATLKKHAKDIHGRRQDLFVLSRDLSHIWETLRERAENFLPAMD